MRCDSMRKKREPKEIRSKNEWAWPSKDRILRCQTRDNNIFSVSVSRISTLCLIIFCISKNWYSLSTSSASHHHHHRRCVSKPIDRLFKSAAHTLLLLLLQLLQMLLLLLLKSVSKQQQNQEEKITPHNRTYK